MQLENSLLMYGVYNAETLEKLIDTMYNKHNTTSLHERLFAGQQIYIALYRELITQLFIYASAIRILARGYLPISLVTPSKLREILKEVKTAMQTTNPYYDLVVDRLHLYYDMQLVMFGIDKGKNLIIKFPVFVQPCTQQPLILYQLETVPVPIIDQNMQAHSYTHCKEFFVVKRNQDTAVKA